MSASVFDHPWLGGLFADPDMAEVWSSERQLAHMLAFEQALAEARAAVGDVPRETADAALKAMARFQPDIEALRQGTAKDGLPVPELKRQLQAAAGRAADAVHEGATSQDVLDTALALTLKKTTALLLRRLERLDDALVALEAQHGARPLMGRTRMQAAVLTTVGTRLGTWRRPLAGHRRRLEAARPRVELLQLGGPVGDRASLGANADAIARHMADALGLADPGHAWHATRENVAEYASLLALISGSLGKIGQDVCLMAQQGIDEIRLAGGGGSSAMPHKQNPVLAELLVTLARYNAVQMSAMHGAQIHEQERSGSAWTLEWMVLPGMAMATGRGLTATLTLAEDVVDIGTRE